jgi:hypothetical protein
MVAIARWKGKSSYGKLMPGSVDVMNDRSFCYARKFVFAHAKSDAILARGVELRGKVRKSPSRNFGPKPGAL